MGVFVRQLDGSPMAGDNCGPASLASALRWSTRHSVAPTPTVVRAKMRDTDGGTNPADMRTGWNAFAKVAERRGYKLAGMRYHRHAEWVRLRETLETGDGALVAVDYSVAGDLSGDPDFLGLHAMFAAGIVEQNGERYARIFDPLCDGRRRGIPGPGPVLWPLALLREATGRYSDAAGKATWNAVSRSQRLPDNSCAAQLADMAEELEKAQDDLAAAYRRLNEAAGTAEEAIALLATLQGLRSALDIGDPNAAAGRGLVRG